MKKLKLAPLLLFLLACHNNPTETNNLSKDTTVTDYAIDTNKLKEDINATHGDTVNFTDANNLKQGIWLVFENGELVKKEWYKDGKLVDKP